MNKFLRLAALSMLLCGVLAPAFGESSAHQPALGQAGRPAAPGLPQIAFKSVFTLPTTWSTPVAERGWGQTGRGQQPGPPAQCNPQAVPEGGSPLAYLSFAALAFLGALFVRSSRLDGKA
jgi:hypothetical protein